MGMLVDGKWQIPDVRADEDGVFRRAPTALPIPSPQALANVIKKHPKPVLVASASCPWSHRTTLVRAMRHLESIPLEAAGGPRVEGYGVQRPGALQVKGRAVRHVHQLYTATNPCYTGRATVPILWDRVGERILCNDSKTIARAFDHLGTNWRLAPDPQTPEIDALNDRIYNGLANAVYRAGFATSQAAYEAATDDVFGCLDWLDKRLAGQRCLIGCQVTEADLFLLPTLLRFDAIYGPLFRCTRRRLTDYQALWAYTRDMISLPGLADTFDQDSNLAGYFLNDTDNNPHGIIPNHPDLDWDAPHHRQSLGVLTLWQDGRLVALEDAVRGNRNA